MEFSIATLLANFTNDKLVAAKVLEKKLGCQDEPCLTKLQIALEALEKTGILLKERGKYRRVNEEGTIEAKLRCSSKGFCFAIQEVEGAEDIYIRESQLSNAWNGDRVLVKLTKEGSRRRSPEGEVRLILERANQSLLARVKQTNRGFRAVPLDDRLLFELDLQNGEDNLAEIIDHLVHVGILRYSLGQSPPIGRVVQVLGSDAEAAADTDLVCCKHDLPRTFPPAVLEAVAGLPTQLSKADLKQRLDLRSLLTLAIGGEGSGEKSVKGDNSSSSPASLVETAFTLGETETGHWQVGIHTADVAQYVLPDSPLERESLKRGSCVYLGKTVLPLLPEAIEQRCSLVPGSDRLTISVLLTLDSAGQLVEFEIQPAVIQVDHYLSEQEVQTILEVGREQASSEEALPLTFPEPVVELLGQLFTLSQAVKEQRRQRGSFELKLPQYQYPYYDEEMLGVIVVTESPARSLLTEFSVLANQVVADHLRSLGIPAIYRIQPAPDLEEAQELVKLASNLGVDLRLDQEDAVQPQDYQHFTQQFVSPDSEQVLTYILRDTLKPAVFSTTPQPHFGLALKQGYVRCNSPLRRYPDLLIQRVLHVLFQEGRDRRTTRAKERVNLRHSASYSEISWNVLPPEVQQELEADLAKVIVPLNEREKEVQDAEADLAGLQKAQLMKERTGEVFHGLITGVQSYGFFVEIEVPNPSGRLLRVEGLVHVSSLKDDWYEYRARQQALFGRKNRAAYRLGDRVAVQVKSVDYYRQQIDLVTVNGDHQPNSPDEFNSLATHELNHEDTDPYADEE